MKVLLRLRDWLVNEGLELPPTNGFVGFLLHQLAFHTVQDTAMSLKTLQRDSDIDLPRGPTPIWKRAMCFLCRRRVQASVPGACQRDCVIVAFFLLESAMLFRVNESLCDCQPGFFQSIFSCCTPLSIRLSSTIRDNRH